MLWRFAQVMQRRALPQWQASGAARFVGNSKTPQQFLPLPAKSTDFQEVPRWYMPDFTPEMHLSEDGVIQSWILDCRWQWLKERGLLYNPFVLDDIQYYSNYHLYSAHQLFEDQSNLERMCQGYAPLCPYGSPMVIHHFDQRQDGVRVVLPDWLHRRYDLLLHSKVEVAHPVDRTRFAQEKRSYWKEQSLEHLCSRPDDVTLLSKNLRKRLKLS